jgi:hypothetical protein
MNYGDHTAHMLLPRDYIVNRWVDISTMAVIFMLMMLISMKYFGFSRTFKKVRRDLIASAYEILLYHRNVRIILKAEWKLLWCNLKLLILLSPSLFVGGLLFAVFYNTLSDRYAFRAFQPGEKIVARITSADIPDRIVNDNEKIEITARVYAHSANTVWIRLVPKQAGILSIETDHKTNNGLFLDLISSDRPALPHLELSGMAFDIRYPHRLWMGWSHGWLIVFFMVCLITTVPMARWLRISI